MERQEKQQPQQKNTVRKLLIGSIIVAALLLAAIIVIGLGGGGQMGTAPSQNTDLEETIYGDEYLAIDPRVDEELQDYRNVILFGIDQDAHDGQENTSDDFLIVSFHKDTDEMKMASVNGRTYLKIDEETLGGVNNAYKIGGIDQVIKSFNRNLDLNIREGLALPWDMIAALIDEIGGIEIEDSEEKMQTFDGKQAVAYARSQEGHNRMQMVFMAALKKAKTMKSEELIPILDEVMPQTIQRSMNSDQVSALLMEMSVYDTTVNISWPYDVAEPQGEQKLLIPQTLQSNVIQLHQDLFGQHNYAPTDFVKNTGEQIENQLGYAEAQ